MSKEQIVEIFPEHYKNVKYIAIMIDDMKDTFIKLGMLDMNKKLISSEISFFSYYFNNRELSINNILSDYENEKNLYILSYKHRISIDAIQEVIDGKCNHSTGVINNCFYLTKDLSRILKINRVTVSKKLIGLVTGGNTVNLYSGREVNLMLSGDLNDVSIDKDYYVGYRYLRDRGIPSNDKLNPVLFGIKIKSFIGPDGAVKYLKKDVNKALANRRNYVKYKEVAKELATLPNTKRIRLNTLIYLDIGMMDNPMVKDTYITIKLAKAWLGYVKIYREASDIEILKYMINRIKYEIKNKINPRLTITKVNIVNYINYNCNLKKYFSCAKVNYTKFLRDGYVSKRDFLKLLECKLVKAEKSKDGKRNNVC